MSKKVLVIVESPAKCKKIASFLEGLNGYSYIVKASYGHFRDLAKGTSAINTENNLFTPKYEIKKHKIANELKSAYKKCNKVVIATDLDREGEGIGWHLTQLLKLDPSNTERIVFNEITETAVRDAMKNPTTLNMDLVYAQQARRIMDRLIGFSISPLLWRHFQPNLSAGRCQSPAMQLVYDRETNIGDFDATNYFETTGTFQSSNASYPLTLDGILNNKFDNQEEAETLLNSYIENQSSFILWSVIAKESKNHPPPPYTTSTLQQDASNKAGISPKVCMSVAQKLYEAGKITYMRTDSVELSKDALNMCKGQITKAYGKQYYNKRTFKTKTAHSQEAHEAIRPVNMVASSIPSSFSSQEQKLYTLIYQRTLASQMSPSIKKILTCKIYFEGNENENKNKTDSKITKKQYFTCKEEQIMFLGYLKAYGIPVDKGSERIHQLYKILENNNPNNIDDNILPLKMNYNEIKTQEKYTKSQGRYSEATLIKELEKKGIGRPATFSNLVSIIQDRGYVVKDTRAGNDVPVHTLTTTDGEDLVIEKGTVKLNGDSNKLFLTDTGKVVIKFLKKYFENIMNYEFTGNISDELDLIAKGQLAWNEVVGKVYNSFYPTVEKLSNTKEIKREKHQYKRTLGDNKDGDAITVYLGKYGPLVQIGNYEDHKKNSFVSIPKHLSLDTITLEEALKLCESFAIYDNKEINLKSGRYGYYLTYDGNNISIPNAKKRNMKTFKGEEAVLIIKDWIKNGGASTSSSGVIKEFAKDLSIKKGPYGNYIRYKTKNIPLPKDIKTNEEKLKTLTKKEVMEFVNNPPERKGRYGKKTIKKTTEKTIKKASKKL